MGEEFVKLLKVISKLYGEGIASDATKLSKKIGEDNTIKALNHALSLGLNGRRYDRWGNLHINKGLLNDNYKLAMSKYIQYLSTPDSKLINNKLLNNLTSYAEWGWPIRVEIKIPESEKRAAQLWAEEMERNKRLEGLKKTIENGIDRTPNHGDTYNWTPRTSFRLSDDILDAETEYPTLNSFFDDPYSYKHGGNLTMKQNLTTLFLDYLKKGGVMKALPGNKINSKPRITIDDKEIERRARKKWENDSVIINNGYDDLHYANNGHKGEINIDKYGDDKWHPNKKLYREEERKKVQKKLPGGIFDTINIG